MATADPALLDARLRAVDAALARGIHRTTVEHAVTTSAGTSVRVVEFGGTDRESDSGAPDGGISDEGESDEGESDEGVSDARPPVVLLHGIASVTALALPVVAALAGRRILAVDWPGHGLSGAEVLPKGAELRAHVGSVLDAVWSTLRLDTADLVGHSLGGHFGLLYALAHPDRIRRLVLLGAPGAAFDGATAPLGMRLAAVPGLGSALLGLSVSQPATRRGFVRTLGAQAVDALPQETLEVAHLSSQRSQFGPTVASLFRTMMTPFAVRPDVPLRRAELATLAAPTLLVLGDEDAILTQTAATGSMSAIPEGTTHEVTGGHAPWLDDPTVSPAVAAFLNR